MATYLTLVNLALTRLNEVLLTSATFSQATGPQAQMQIAVNAAIFDISRREQQWPFNYVKQSFTTTPGTQEYTPPSNVKVIKWSTFGITPNPSASPAITARTLWEADYNQYARTQRPMDQNMLSTQWSVPMAVIKGDDGSIILSPPPGDPTNPAQTYNMYYDSWADSAAMAAYTDTCAIPDIYNYVIVDGAMYYGYDFRSDIGARQEAKNKFDEGITEMQRELIKPTDSFQSTQLIQSRSYNSIPSRYW